jgi:NAD+ synthase
MDLTAEQVERVFRDIDAKRKAAQYLHARPLLAENITDAPA